MFDYAVEYIQAQTLQSFFHMYWFLILIEFPLFVMGGLSGLFSIYWHLPKQHSLIRLSKKHTQISVIVPAHNNGPAVAKTVVSLNEQIGVNLQIIVINDGSTDETDFLCKKLYQNKLIDKYIKLESRGGKAAALNIGLKYVEHEYVLSTDADTTFYRDALIQALAYFSDPRVGAVSGNLRIRNARYSLCTMMQQFNFVASITIGRIFKDLLGFYFVISGAFGLYKTDAIKSVGGWNYGPGDDGDMSVQIRLSGWRVRFAPLAVSSTSGPETFARLGRQRLRWYRSMIRVRLRKFRSRLLNPKNNSFNAWIAFSILEAVFVQAIIPILFITYVTWLLMRYGAFALVILLSIHLIYMLLYTLEYCCYLSISKEKSADMKLIPFIPFYSIFNSYFLRLVALYSTLNELALRRSYRDEFYPKKVRARVRKF